MSKCKYCINDKSWCKKCIDNPFYQEILAKLPKHSYFMDYIPACPRGYSDCVGDPAYIKFNYPDWYKELYGDISPEEAIHVNGCYERFIEDPDMENYCYDDEDK